jgi:hypothetical protein
LDFPFTPQLDGQFLKVAGTLLPSYSASEIKVLSAKTLFEKLAPVLMPEDGISFFAAMTLPYFHNMPTDARYRTFYCDFGKKQHCEVLRRINKTNVVNEASYDEPTRKSRIAMLHSGRVERYILLETDEGRGAWVKAPGRVQEMELNIDGPDLLKTPDYDWKGNLNVWSPKGKCEVRKKG